ncbi:T9SS type A sorting domain-containing protein [Flavobacterium sp.]|uniref:T9SS type A sorting domain-containing protein n=1 Tax=Flavobacterium sp. TaxID=239 RepID=UPI00286C9EA0|nr:T9SS type A sorting domain-containing protein [Flavobacterium sp.]
MKKIYFTLILSLAACISKSYAQNNIVASGGSALGSNGSATYSMGQVPFQYQANANYSISQGLQQPFEIIPLGNDSFSTINLGMKVYPNPTESVLVLSVQNFKGLSYEITDVNGRSIQKDTITNVDTSITFESFTSGIYFLAVKNNNQSIKNFKIIKK